MGEFVSALGNPWLPAEWNVTTQGRFLLRYGRRRADQFAALAGTTVGGTAARDRSDPRIFIVQKRHVPTGDGGGATGGRGYSGDGPPQG